MLQWKDNVQPARESHRRLPLPPQSPCPRAGTRPLASLNSSAKSITGDIALSDEKLNINFLTFTMVKVRSLEKAELGAAFDADTNVAGAGNLFRLNIPGTRKFLHKNSLCGPDTHVDGDLHDRPLSPHRLLLGEKPPVFTLSAISNSTDLCGVFEYVR